MELADAIRLVKENAQLAQRRTDDISLDGAICIVLADVHERLRKLEGKLNGLYPQSIDIKR